MTFDPRVTVLMPARNAASSIVRSIVSVLPEFDDAEILVIDDRSTDGTADRALSIGDRRVRVERARGSGLVDALNQGLEQARAPLIARADADDESLPGRLCHQLEVQRTTGADLVAGVAFIVFPDGSPVIDRVRSTTVKKQCPGMTSTSLRIQLHVGSALAHGSVMFRREAVLTAGGYRESMFPAEDYDLWARMLVQGYSLVGDAKPVYRYCVSPEGISQQRSEQQRLKTIEVQRFLDLNDRLDDVTFVSALRAARIEKSIGGRDHLRAYAEALYRLRSVSKNQRRIKWIGQAVAHIVDPGLMARVYRRRLLG